MSGSHHSCWLEELLLAAIAGEHALSAAAAEIALACGETELLQALFAESEYHARHASLLAAKPGKNPWNAPPSKSFDGLLADARRAALMEGDPELRDQAITLALLRALACHSALLGFVQALDAGSGDHGLHLQIKEVALRDECAAGILKEISSRLLAAQPRPRMLVESSSRGITAR
jgi:hypothetical protein